MYIARILYPIKVLGPGNRVGIWFDGCRHKCDKCSNPELWDYDEKYNVSIETIIKLIDTIAINNRIDGFTITGGDPFEQPEALEEVLCYISTISDDVIVYTGYEYNQIKHKNILDKIAVLIDGKYIDVLNEGNILKGSSNQNIIILKDKYKQKYKAYIANAKPEIQNFNTKDGVISVGIHRRGYEENLDSILKKKGLQENG